MWEDVEGQEDFPVSAGFELTIHGLLVQEHNYSATTHSHSLVVCGGCPSASSHTSPPAHVDYLLVVSPGQLIHSQAKVNKSREEFTGCGCLCDRTKHSRMLSVHWENSVA